MNRAAKGARFERLTAELYEAEGWLVVRSAASLGPADLIAMRAGDIPRLVQVKSGDPKRGPWGDFRRAGRAELLGMANKAGAEAVYYFWPNGSGQPQVFWPDTWPVTTRGEPDYIVDSFGCWLWTKSINCKGYGNINRDGHTVAHRWYYEQVYGAIPPGLVLDHLCRVRACVNPEHLEPVTNEENIARGALRKLTDAQVRYLLDSPLPVGEIAAELGISRSYAWNLRRGNGRGRKKVAATDPSP